MKVLGFTDEVTNCDCCGKSNLSGTFAIEAEDGAILHYGSTCVNKVYGKRNGEEIKAQGKQIHLLQTLSWERAVNAVCRRTFGKTGISCYIMLYEGEQRMHNVREKDEHRCTSIRDIRTGLIIRTK